MPLGSVLPGSAAGMKALRRSVDEVADALREKRYPAALRSSEKALRKFGPSAPLLVNYGLALHEVGRYDDALAAYDRAMRAAAVPEARIYNNRASTLMKLERLDEALLDLNSALMLDRKLAEAWRNKGIVLQHCNRLDEALSCYRAAITYDPVSADAHLAECFCFLLKEEFTLGWQGYEWRWLTEGYASARFRSEMLRARWDGSCPAGKTIFVWREQGLGDTIMLSRYCTLLKAQGADVVLWCQPEVRPLFADFGIALWDPDIIGEQTKTPPHDFQAPLGDLPRLCGTTRLEFIPQPTPIHADPMLVAQWRERLELGRVNIGVAWSGNPDHKNDHNRSIPLAEFCKALPEGLRYFALQRDCRPADESTLRDSGISFFGHDIRSMADVAAITALMDLVVSVDTAHVHLAGTMGRPVIALIPFHPDWRWLMRRSDSPWYPSVELVRQRARRDWSGALVEAFSLIAARSRPLS